MSVFVCTVQLPEKVWEERSIMSIEERPAHTLNWTTKELDAMLPGEFGWRKVDHTGVCAIQYVNRTQVRLMVRANQKDVAFAIAKTIAVQLDAKKEHKRRYSRRSPNMNIMAAGNAIAVRHLLPA